MTREQKFMQEAILLSKINLESNEGGPFGCVIVKDEKIIGKGYNRVTGTNDPTAHAEIVAIREACKTLQSFQLEGCEIYTSCEPCPMCLGAIYWARPTVVYYANTRKEAAEAGFDDSEIYEEVGVPMSERKIRMVNIEDPAAVRVFEQWLDKQDKTNY